MAHMVVSIHEFHPQPWVLVPSDVRDAYWIRVKARTMYNKNANKMIQGKWTVILDNKLKDEDDLTVLDKEWVNIKELVLNCEVKQADCSTAITNPQYGDSGLIFCYTESVYDMEDIRRVARAIRRVMEFPQVLWFSVDDNSEFFMSSSDLVFPMFEYTLDNELYATEDCFESFL